MTPNQLNDWCWTEDELWNRIKEIVGDRPVTIFNIKMTLATQIQHIAHLMVFEMDKHIVESFIGGKEDGDV